MSIKNVVTTAVVALAMGAATLSTPAEAFNRFGGGGHGFAHGYGGGPHFGGGYGRHWGYRSGFGWGWWGPAIGLGIVAGAIAGGAYYNGCYRYQTIFDQWGNPVGRQLVNVCY